MPPHRNCVNNEADLAFAAAVEQEVVALLPTLTARIIDKIRQNENNEDNGNRRNGRRGNPGGSGNDGDAQPTDIHVWLERFQKQKPQTFSSASTPVEAENWIAHIENIFEQANGSDIYMATLAWNDFYDIFFLRYFPYSEKEKYEREYKSIRQLDGETSTEFMKRFLRLAAQVSNAARNIEIMCARSGQEGNNKRNIDGHHIQSSEPPTQGPNQRTYDRRDSDRYGNSDRHGNNDRRDRHGNNDRRDKHGNNDRHDKHVNNDKCDRHGNGRQRLWRDQDQQTCHRATGACFTCGEVGHMAKDCKKGSTSNGGNENNKQPATKGRVFALTTDQASNASSTISGTLYMIEFVYQGNSSSSSNAVAGVGPLSGKGPRVIVSADVSILPQSVFVCGGATGAAFKGISPHCRLTKCSHRLSLNMKERDHQLQGAGVVVERDEEKEMGRSSTRELPRLTPVEYEDGGRMRWWSLAGHTAQAKNTLSQVKEMACQIIKIHIRFTKLRRPEKTSMYEDYKSTNLVIVDLHMCVFEVDDDGKIFKLA
ncbi:retrotransposon protein, putative, ty3-gypsy subclass [Tanacetum coccineum]